MGFLIDVGVVYIDVKFSVVFFIFFSFFSIFLLLLLPEASNWTVFEQET